MLIKRISAIALLLVYTACASGSAASTTDGSTPSASTNPDVITAAEIAADPTIAAGDAMQAVQRLRPRFLMARGNPGGSKSGGVVHASIDGGPLVTTDNLSRYSASSIVEIRYVNATDAAQKWGTITAGAGVIMLKSK